MVGFRVSNPGIAISLGIALDAVQDERNAASRRQPPWAIGPDAHRLETLAFRALEQEHPGAGIDSDLLARGDDGQQQAQENGDHPLGRYDPLCDYPPGTNT